MSRPKKPKTKPRIPIWPVSTHMFTNKRKQAKQNFESFPKDAGVNISPAGAKAELIVFQYNCNDSARPICSD